MNINGKNGPTLKQVFTCENCKWLGNSVLGGMTGRKPFKCFNAEISKYDSNLNIMLGNISEELITPKFCPFLLKKIRNEKLKEIENEYRRIKKTST